MTAQCLMYYMCLNDDSFGYYLYLQKKIVYIIPQNIVVVHFFWVKDSNTDRTLSAGRFARGALTSAPFSTS